ncbi:MAG: DUF1080 domain-containing protein [Williamsia sp.]|nr:DUF1080 domain-containing protein [Williamsia sp.]
MNRLFSLFAATCFSVIFSSAIAQDNQLTQKEKAAGWQLLFDGKTSGGWKSANKEGFPEKGWKIENGTISIVPKGGGGDIVSQKEYGDFELSADFKVTEGANSGIKYYVAMLPSSPNGKPSALGLEYQVIDDERHPDAKLGKNGDRRLSSLYDLIPAGSGKKVKPVGEWNNAHIIAKGSHVEHWLNGVKVLEYDRNSDAFKKLIAESKYKDIPGFGLNAKGRILLQDHGDEVYFKNVKIKAKD